MELSSPVKKDMTEEEHDHALLKANEQWMDVLSCAAASDMFLLGCDLFAVPSVILAVLALYGFDVLGLWAVVLFLMFLIVAAVGMVGVGYQNLRQNAREFREKSGAPSRLMDVLNRGMGKR